MAGVNLYRMRRTGPGPGVVNQKLATSGIVLVFAFGLLHGLGFASGIGAIANDTVARLVTLAGFNLGVELGQFLFLASLVLLVKVLSKTGFIRHFAHLSKTVSTAAALFGIMLWLQQMQLLFGH